MALNESQIIEEEKKRKMINVNASELSKVNPVAKAIEDYGNTVPASVKQERIANRQAQFLKSFGGQRAPVMQAETSPSMEVAKPVVAVPLSEINKRTQFANSANEPKTQALYEPPKLKEIKAPVINEVPNAKRDTDLGKMNVAASGNRVTYNIGGNTLSYDLSDDDQKLKSNIEKMDAIIKSGIDPSTGKPPTLAQIAQVNKIKQDAGFLRGGTDRRAVGPDGRPITALRNINAGRVGNLDVQFTGSADNTEARKREFLTPSSYAQSQIDLIRPTVSRNIPGTNQYEETVGQSVEDKRMQEAAQQRKLEQLAFDPKMAEARSNIKLQDIQGQVLQNPPTKKSSKWEMKKIGDAAMGTEQDILFNEDGRSIPINPAPKAGTAVMDAVYQSPKGPVVYKGKNKDGKDIYVPFNG